MNNHIQRYVERYVEEAPESSASTGQVYWRIASRRRVTLVACLAISLVIAAACARLQPPRYRAESRIYVPTSRTAEGSDILSTKAPVSDASGERELRTQLQIIRSWPILKAGALRSGLNIPDSGDTSQIPVVIDGGKDDDIITVSAVSSDRRQAQDLANNIAQVYVEHDLSQNRRRAHAVRMFVETQLAKQRTVLRDASEALRDYQTSIGTAGSGTSTDDVVKALSDAEAASSAASSDLRAAVSRAALTREALAKTSSVIVASRSIARNPSIDRLEEQISNLQAMRVSLGREYAPGSEKLTSIDAQIAAAAARQKALVREILTARQEEVNPAHQALVSQLVVAEGDVLAVRARLAGWERTVQTDKDLLRQLPEQQYRLAQLQRSVQSAEKTYVALQDRYQSLRIAEESTLADAQVVETARLPRHPFSPRLAINVILGLMLGLVLGVVVAAMQETLDDHLRTAEEVERLLSLPVLGLVHRLPEHGAGSTSKAACLWAEPEAEAFRFIRSNLRLRSDGIVNRSFVVTSSCRGEGKSFVSSELALAVARSGRTVILVDSDLQRPTLHIRFGLRMAPGLSDVLGRDVPLASAIQKTEDPLLTLLSAGAMQPRSAELLDSERFVQLLAELRGMADVILFDAPPVLGAADASVLAGAVDATIFVAAPGNLERQDAVRAVKLLSQAGAHSVGIVINRVEGRDSYYAYGSALTLNGKDGPSDEPVSISERGDSGQPLEGDQ